jgi:hypothetical protein
MVGKKEGFLTAEGTKNTKNDRIAERPDRASAETGASAKANQCSDILPILANMESLIIAPVNE